MSCDIVIAGGGAAGIVAAIAAAREGARVCIADSNPRLGRKLLSTGNGRCNYGNMNNSPDRYHSKSMDIVRAVLDGFPPEAVISFFEEMGVVPHVQNGYIYPYTNQAKDFLECLLMEVKRLGIDVINNVKIYAIKAEEPGYALYCSSDEKKTCIRAGTCIIACGGRAFPVSGSNGSGYELAKSLGHTVTDIAPALVELTCSEAYFSSLKGIRLKAGVTIYVDNAEKASDTGEIQLTQRGISGIPVFNVSRHATLAMGQNKEVTAKLDLLPFVSETEELLSLRFLENGWGKSVSDALVGLFDKRVIRILLKEAGLSGSEDAVLTTKSGIRRLAGAIKGLRVHITGSGGYDKAQTTAGGVSLEEIDKVTMESKIRKGLYLCGEVLDADGECGGFNLTWAWASGIRAGRFAARRVV